MTFIGEVFYTTCMDTVLLDTTPAGLKRIRTFLELTQKALAGLLGVSEWTIHRWERGQGKPGLLHLRELNRLVREAGG